MLIYVCFSELTFLCLVRKRKATRLVLIMAEDWMHAAMYTQQLYTRKHKKHHQ